MELTMLMSTLNKALTIETCIRKARAYLERRSFADEVLVANKGSTDGSPTFIARGDLRERAVLTGTAALSYGPVSGPMRRQPKASPASAGSSVVMALQYMRDNKTAATNLLRVAFLAPRPESSTS